MSSTSRSYNDSPERLPADEMYTNLVALHAIGAIDDLEFAVRKNQLINNLTGTVFEGGAALDSTSDYAPDHVQRKKMGSTSPSTSPASPSSSSETSDADSSTSGFSFSASYDSDLALEPAVRLDYDADTSSWRQCETVVQVDNRAFARGNMRKAYRMRDALSRHRKWFVAKRYYRRETGDDDDTVPIDDYFADIVMQATAQQWAQRFNDEDPPKRVEFVPTWLIRLLNREGTPYYACEPRIKGEFRKHNNNGGWKSSDERSTPQAFSHFTYERSGGALMVVDVQGVSVGEKLDLLTDPQIHSIDGSMFSAGNFSTEGFDDFFRTHECNKICAYLGLRLRGRMKVEDDGTLVNENTMREKLEKQHSLALNLQRQLDYERQQKLNHTAENLGAAVVELARARAAYMAGHEANGNPKVVMVQRGADDATDFHRHYYDGGTDSGESKEEYAQDRVVSRPRRTPRKRRHRRSIYKSDLPSARMASPPASSTSSSVPRSTPSAAAAATSSASASSPPGASSASVTTATATATATATLDDDDPDQAARSRARAEWLSRKRSRYGKRSGKKLGKGKRK